MSIKRSDVAPAISAVEVETQGECSLAGLYAAHPDADEHAPCVVLIHDVQGMGFCMRSALLRLAAEGYHALCVDLFAHAGLRPAADALDAERAWSELPDRPALLALESALGWIAKRGDRRSVALVGLGMGGSLAFLMGCTSRGLAAVVSCYGTTLYPALSRNKPAQPLELFLNLERPFLGIFAEFDESMPREHHQLLTERLEAGHKQHELVHYPGTQHGFLDPGDPNYDEASASAAWQRTLAFLKDAL